MSTKQETGNAKNIANFSALINFCIKLEARYSPSEKNLEIAEMNTLLEQTIAAQKETEVAKSAYSATVDIREESLKDLMQTLNLIFHALRANDVSVEAIMDATNIIRMIRSIPKTRPVPASAENTPENERTQNDSHHFYLNRVNHFGDLIELLDKTPDYKPEESELTIPGLKKQKDLFLAQCQDVHAAYVELSKKRGMLNSLLNTSKTGLIDVAHASKSYISTILTPSGGELKQLARIQFKTTGQY